MPEMPARITGAVLWGSAVVGGASLEALDELALEALDEGLEAIELSSASSDDRDLESELLALAASSPSVGTHCA
jgi:predicted dinucleotide-utilizing enzyme